VVGNNKITINNNKVDGINQITMEDGETVIITITMVADGTNQVILDGVTNLTTTTIIIAVGQIIVVTIVVGDNSNNRAIVDGVMETDGHGHGNSNNGW
jgi:hypothetical protein